MYRETETENEIKCERKVSIEDSTKLYSIGTLSRIVGISPDTLRYYDEIGLLKPAFTSEQTGYRYYSDSQATVIARIIELKHYGFSLNKIKEILMNGESPSIVIFQDRYAKLLHEKKQLDEAINKLSTKILKIQEGTNMKKSILLVDDAAFMRGLQKDMLSREGYVLAGEANDGNEAVELFGKLKPDLITLDIIMPNLDGISALKKIKEQQENAKVVMCSAMGQIYMVTEALIAGASDFVVKPFAPERLLQAYSVVLKETRKLSIYTLTRIHDYFYEDKSKILRQEEIDEIIEFALERDTPPDMRIEDFIQHLEQKLNNPERIENKIAIVPLEQVNNPLADQLKKMELSQEEVKKMLATLCVPPEQVNSSFNDRLTKMEQSQEEIKEMLAKLLENKG